MRVTTALKQVNESGRATPVKEPRRRPFCAGVQGSLRYDAGRQGTFQEYAAVSEYQYYEFQTVDRPLTDTEMKELRALSSRAEITRTSFSNEYNYGNFRGDETAV